MFKRLDYFTTHTNDKLTLRWGKLYTIKKRSDIILIFLLTYLFSVKPQRKKKPKSKTHKSNTLLVEKIYLMEFCLSGVLPNIKSWFYK